MRYSLQNKDISLIDFRIDMQIENINGIASRKTAYSIEKIHSEHTKIFPKDIEEYTGEAIQRWIDNRKAPKNRQFINKILSVFEDAKNPMTFLDITHALSLNDTYWVNCMETPMTWDDCSLYTHKFSEILAYVAFTGYSSRKVHGVISSPEFTTGGAQKKCWSNRENGIFLVKGASPLYDAPERQERTDVVAEYCASQIASEMNFSHVDYDIEQFTHYDGSRELVSVCRLFTSEEEGYLPFHVYAARQGLPTHHSALSDYATELKFAELYGKEAFEDMMLFDSLILNTDRHMTNFGMMFDTDTGEILHPAPLFDHGMSLLVGAAKSDLKTPEDYASTLESHFGLSFKEQGYRFVQSRHIPQLQEMRSFYFKRHPLIPFAEEYLSNLERYIHSRAAHIIKLYQKKKQRSSSFQR